MAILCKPNYIKSPIKIIKNEYVNEKYMKFPIKFITKRELPTFQIRDVIYKKKIGYFIKSSITKNSLNSAFFFNNNMEDCIIPI